MLYNIYVSTHLGTYNLFGLSIEQVEIIKNSYMDGDKHFTIAGNRSHFEDVNSLQIFQHEIPGDPLEAEQRYLSNPLYRKKSLFDYYLPESTLLRMGKNVTFEIIGNSQYGERKHLKNKNNQQIILPSFISLDRLDKLRSINSKDFDLSKLIKLCEEMNDNYQRNNFMSVGMIGRTILNHIPPLFGFRSFEEVSSNYGSSKNSSFKKNMSHLNSSLKNIADSYLHLQIRKKESLPNEIQVDFKQDFDVLLAEIIRIL